MKIRCFNIIWDTDGEKINLPNETEIFIEDDSEISIEGADKLSDHYGWCINSFEFEIITP